jgi:hypothetical protein
MKYTAKQQFDQFKADKTFLDTRCFYFYDWFCRDKSLENKARALMTKAITFAKLLDIDLDKHYVWFKNNCPMNGSLYDDFRFADEEGNTIWTVVPKCGHKVLNNRAEVWGVLNGFDDPILISKNWSDLLGEIASGKLSIQSEDKSK